MTIICFNMQIGTDSSIFKLIIQYALVAVVALGNLVEVITGYSLFCYLFDLVFLYNINHIFLCIFVSVKKSFTPNLVVELLIIL